MEFAGSSSRSSRQCALRVGFDARILRDSPREIDMCQVIHEPYHIKSHFEVFVDTQAISFKHIAILMMYFLLHDIGI